MVEQQEEVQEKISLAEIIPVQNSDPVAVRIQASGEFRLLWAIFDDAVDCYLRYWNRPSEQAQALHRESVEWIESSEEEWLCSFISICRAFSIEPSYMRNGLRLKLQEVQAAEHAASMQRAA